MVWGGGAVSAAQVWAAGAGGALVLVISVYLVLLFRAVQNERVIDIAVAAMSAAMAAEPSPQRALLSAVADTLVAQERTAAQIEVAVHDLALRGHPVPQPDELLKALLNLPEPQLLVADFLREYGGGPGSASAFASVAGDLLRAGTTEVYGDLADEGSAELDRLLLLAAEGRIATVALAGLDGFLVPGPPDSRAPRVADLDPSAMVALARALDRMTRRHLRLATLLHGQAEAMLRPRPNERRFLARLRTRVLQLVRYPPVRKPAFGPSDLAALAVAFDAVGEVVDIGAERLAEGEPMQAAHLLAGLRVPVPAGLPGRMYHQESLAHVRPLAVFGVWHRLAVSRWATSALDALAKRAAEPPASSGSSAGSPARNPRDEGVMTSEQSVRTAG